MDISATFFRITQTLGKRSHLDQHLSLTLVLLCPLLLLSLPRLSNWMEWQYFKYRSRPKGYQRVGEYEDSTGPLTSGNASVDSGQTSSKGTATRATIHDLVIYPIKSCGYSKVKKAPFGREGLLFDRLFCFAQQETSQDPNTELPTSSWKFMTQRSLPNMARIKVEIWLRGVYEKSSLNTDGLLLLKFPSGSSARPPWLVRLPLTPSTKDSYGRPRKLDPVSIWKDTPSALKVVSTESSQPPVWLLRLRQFLKVSKHIGLFYLPQDHLREVFRNAPTAAELGYQPSVAFGDSYPLHMVNLASVKDLAQVIDQRAVERETEDNPERASEEAINHLRFRPNLVVKGSLAWEEDHWTRIKIIDSEFIVTNRAGRCPMPNIDQDTGAKHHREPLATMKEERCIDEGAPSLPCFGMMMVPVPRKGVVSVGDFVEILETGKHRYINQ